MRLAGWALALSVSGLVLGQSAAAHAATDPAAKAKTLQQLDASARNFHNAAMRFEFDTYQTDPVPDKDVMTGMVYYERKGNTFQMAAHIQQDNGKPVNKVYALTGGQVKLYEGNINQVTTVKRATDFASYFMLGFGASGKELADKWDITDLGPETLDGVRTEKLELIAKDATVRKNLPKVTVWMDLARAISLKQVFDEGGGQSRVSVYFNIKMNQPLPPDAFTFKTDSKTTYVNR